MVHKGISRLMQSSHARTLPRRPEIPCADDVRWATLCSRQPQSGAAANPGFRPRSSRSAAPPRREGPLGSEGTRTSLT